jgi:arylsulfatase A-like enzyme
MKRLILLLLVIPVLTAAGLYWWLSSPPTRPNIVLITIDTARADHLGIYGYARQTSPNIDHLAATGVVFENAFTQSSLSAPSHATILTGVSPPTHGVLRNTDKIPDHVTRLADVLQGAGYETAAFVGHPLVGGDFGFFRGFDTSEVHHLPAHAPDHGDQNHRYKLQPEDVAKPGDLFDAALEWLDRAPEDPYFLWLHAQNPHQSYDPPPPYDRMFMEPPSDRHLLRCAHTLYKFRKHQLHLNKKERAYFTALYDGELAFVDTQIGRVVERLRDIGDEADTIVVITSDHGEALPGEGQGRMNGHSLIHTDAVLRVPLVISGGPVSSSAGTRIVEMVDLVDVAPTLLDLSGVRAPASWEGRSLNPLLRGEGLESREATFAVAFSIEGNYTASVRTPELKLICDQRGPNRCRLLDVTQTESRLFKQDSAYEPAMETLRPALFEWLGDVFSRPVVPLSPNAIEMLRRAGYLEDPDEKPSR